MPEGRSGWRPAWVLAAVLITAPGTAAAADPGAGDPVVRGEYVFHASGCVNCHTAPDGPPLAGGRELQTPFGTFYGPNITPDAQTGIGGWSEQDFVRALRHGRAPGGSPYYPAFPYTSFAGMTDQDARDLWAYLRAQEPVPREVPPHDLNFPFNLRPLLYVWQWLFHDPPPLPEAPDRSEEWRRGRYLVLVLGHCAECHTPRNALGALRWDRLMAGSAQGPEGKPVPNITSDPEAGIGRWSVEDIAFLLEIGMTPEGDFVGGGMNEVVQNVTSRLTPEDRRAIAVYLKSLPPRDGPEAGS